MIIPNPLPLTWERWAQTLVQLSPELANQLNSNGIPDWQDFARRLTLIKPMTPRAELQPDWQSWALALRRAYNQ